MASNSSGNMNSGGGGQASMPGTAMTDQEIDEAVTEMQAQIHKEIAEKVPLVGDKELMSSLLQEYADDDEVYLQKINLLSQKYSHLRRMRGDGNCFYRAFGFGYMEALLSSKETLGRFRENASRSKDGLVKLGYPTFTLEDFHDQFISVIDQVANGMSLNELLEVFRDDGVSSYIVVYLRLIASCYLQQHGEFFQNFIDENRTIQDFCKGEVEPMDRESDHIHIIALTKALDICVRVAYVDRTDPDKIVYHDFPEGSTPQLHVLYRPGHYDVIYPQ